MRRSSGAVSTIDWTPEAAEKGGYEHFMLKEMHEQPTALLQAITGRVTTDDRIEVAELAGLGDVLRTVDRVELIACGTAYYASLVGAAAIQDWVGIPARANIGSEFRYSPPPLDGEDARHRGDPVGRDGRHDRPDAAGPRAWLPVIAVTNTVGSAITREAAAVLFLQAGPEIAVAASKTFVTQVTTLVILAAAIAKARGRLGARAGARARRGAPAPAEAGPAARSTPRPTCPTSPGAT